MAERTGVRGVVTQPDRPSGRGQKVRPTPVKVAALELGLRVYEPTKLRAFTERLGTETWDAFGLASYGRILPQGLLDRARLGALNVHPSLLPRYRGATPIQAALANGDAFTGVSIMLMNAGMDTGDVISQERVAIVPTDDYGTLHDRLASIGAHMLGEAITMAERGPLVRTPQQGEPSATRPIARDDLAIDWNWDAQRIVNQVRAYSPQPAARAAIEGQTLKVLHAHAVPSSATHGAIGEIDAGYAEVLVVRCADAAVALDEIVLPNRGREPGTALLARRAARQRPA